MLPPELEDLADEVGDFVCFWGFKKIHGRLWTHVYLSDQPLDAAHLMHRLGVSKALISLTIHDLLKYKVILEAGKSARGTQLFTANLDILTVITNILRQRERRMLARAEVSQRMLASLPSAHLQRFNLNPARIQALGRFVESAQSRLATLLERSTIQERLESPEI